MQKGPVRTNKKKNEMVGWASIRQTRLISHTQLGGMHSCAWIFVQAGRIMLQRFRSDYGAHTSGGILFASMDASLSS